MSLDGLGRHGNLQRPARQGPDAAKAARGSPLPAALRPAWGPCQWHFAASGDVEHHGPSLRLLVMGGSEHQLAGSTLSCQRGWLPACHSRRRPGAQRVRAAQCTVVPRERSPCTALATPSGRPSDPSRGHSVRACALDAHCLRRAHRTERRALQTGGSTEYSRVRPRVRRVRPPTALRAGGRARSVRGRLRALTVHTARECRQCRVSTA